MKKSIPIFYLLLFAFFLVVSFCTPLTGDDWTWGTSKGIERLQDFFKDYNGRYASNILEIIMTRYAIIRLVFFAVFSTLLIILTGKLIPHKTDVSSKIAFFLFLLVPTAIYAQTFGWLAGFVNYVPSIVLLLVYLVWVKNIVEPVAPTYKTHAAWYVVPLGFFSTLIVEHVTLFIIFTGFLVIAYTYYTHKKVYALHLSYFISSLLGSLVMFTNGAYINVLLGKDTYRTVREYDSMFDRFYVTYKESMYQPLFMDNKFIWLILSVLVCLVMVKTIHQKKWIERGAKPLLLCSISSFTLFNLLFDFSLGSRFLGDVTQDVEAIFSLVFFVSILAASLMFTTNRYIQLRLTYYAMGIVLLTIPFVFITPYGPRCVFGAYTFIVLMVIELFVYLTEGNNWSLRGVTQCIMISNGVIMVVFTLILSMNYIAHQERIEHMYQDIQEKKQVITMKELPFPQFHWMSSPKAIYEVQMETFKEFYAIPSDTTIELIPYFQPQRMN